MPVDPSWVPATVATCTATLVAIVGGMVGARRVQDASEDRQANAAVRALTEAVVKAEEAARRAHGELVVAEANIWLATMARHLVSINRQGLSVEAALRDTPSEDLPTLRDPGELQPYLDDVMGRVAKARSDVQSFYNRKPILIPHDWRLASQALEVANKRPRDALTVVIYCCAFAAVYEDWAEQNPLQDGEEGDRQMTGNTKPAQRPAQITNAGELTNPTAIVERSQESTETLRHEESVARRKLDEAKSQLSLAQVRKGALSGRPGDRLLFIVLAGLGLSGVAAPLAVLAYGVRRLPHAVDWVWVAVVTVGILTVLVLLSGKTLKAAFRLTFVPRDEARTAKAKPPSQVQAVDTSTSGVVDGLRVEPDKATARQSGSS